MADEFDNTPPTPVAAPESLTAMTATAADPVAAPNSALDNAAAAPVAAPGRPADMTGTAAAPLAAPNSALDNAAAEPVAAPGRPADMTGTAPTPVAAPESPADMTAGAATPVAAPESTMTEFPPSAIGAPDGVDDGMTPTAAAPEATVGGVMQDTPAELRPLPELDYVTLGNGDVLLMGTEPLVVMKTS